MSHFAEAFAPHDVRPVQIFIPARNERALIGTTLRALAEQRDLECVSVVVLANGCDDDTSHVARGFARAFGDRLRVIDLPLAACPPNIGALRGSLFDAAAKRALRAGMPRALLVSLDADTIVAPDWIATLVREAAPVDAVAGYVTIADPEAHFSASFAALYRRFLALGDLLARAESRIDPRADDPYPRHGSFVAASFAVTAEAYVRAGGLPAIGQYEDRLFERALARSGARVRHSLALRSFTSARRDARVAGGFGTLVAHLEDCAARGVGYRVPDPQPMVRCYTIRAAVRRMWFEGDRAVASVSRDAAAVRSALGITQDETLRRLRSAATIGDAFDAFDVEAVGSAASDVPIEEALLALRRLLDASADDDARSA